MFYKVFRGVDDLAVEDLDEYFHIDVIAELWHEEILLRSEIILRPSVVHR